MSIKSKQKGNSYERLIASEFSERFNDTFKRVPQSGAIVGGQNRSKNLQLREDAQEILAGDIICPKWFPFSVETKNYGEKQAPNFYTLLENDSSKLEEWLDQAKGDAEFAKKDYLILCKITRKSQYAIVDFETFKKKSSILPEKYIIYKGSIVIDKKTFINTFIDSYIDCVEKEYKNSFNNI